MNINDLIIEARRQNASDIHLTVGLNPIFRINGLLVESSFCITSTELLTLLTNLCSPSQLTDLSLGIDVDFSYIIPNSSFRQRVNIFKQRDSLAAVFRLLNDCIPTLSDLGLPPIVESLVKEPRGLILVTGPTGSGKSTTLASMVDYINKHKRMHIITIEDPIEYVYEPSLSLIHQREVGRDVKSFSSALRSCLREDPDVILVGEMRDYETISAALTAAETGHLVLSTLHTTSASSTVDRIIDVFPPESHQQIRTQLSTVLKGVITQNLIPLKDGSGRVAAVEILMSNDAVSNVIRENKCHQISSVLQMGLTDGMQSMNYHLSKLVISGRISLDSAYARATDKSELKQYLNSLCF